MNRIGMVTVVIAAMLLFNAVGWAAEPVNLKWAAFYGEDTFQAIIDEFNRAHDGRIFVEYVRTPGARAGAEQLISLTIAGVPPDIGVINGVFAADLLDKIGLNLDAYIERDNFDLSRFVPVSVEEKLLRRGSRYGLPFTFETRYLALNTTMIDAAGLPIPDRQWNLDDFWAIAEKIARDENGDGTLEFYAVGAGLPWRDPWAYLFGGNYLDPITGEFTMDRPEFLAGLELFYDIMNVRRLGLRGDAPANFFNQQVGMTISFEPMISAYVSSQIYERFAMKAHYLPQVDGVTTSWFATHYLAIHRDSQHPDEAWEFLKFWYSPEVQAWLGRLNQAPPTREGIQAKSEIPLPSGWNPRDVIAPMMEYGERFASLPTEFPGFAEALSTIIQPAFEAFFTGEKPPAQIVAEISESVKATLAAAQQR